jgi:hypothetical protein
MDGTIRGWQESVSTGTLEKAPPQLLDMEEPDFMG